MEKKMSARRIALITASGAAAACTLAPAVQALAPLGTTFNNWQSTSDTNYLTGDLAHWSLGVVPTSQQQAYFGAHTGLVDPNVAGTVTVQGAAAGAGTLRLDPGATTGWAFTGGTSGTISFGYQGALVVASGSNTISPIVKYASATTQMQIASGASLELTSGYFQTIAGFTTITGTAAGAAGTLRFSATGTGIAGAGSGYNRIHLGSSGTQSPTIELNANNVLGAAGTSGPDTLIGARYWSTDGNSSATAVKFEIIGSTRTFAGAFSASGYNTGYSFNTGVGNQDLTVANSVYLYTVNSGTTPVNQYSGLSQAPLTVGNHTVQFNGFYAFPGATSSGQILHKEGAGTLRFTGNFTAGGALTNQSNLGRGYKVGGGTLLFNASSTDTTAAQVVTGSVLAGATLGGKGTFDFALRSGASVDHVIAGNVAPGDPSINSGVGSFTFGSATNATNNVNLSASTSSLQLDMSGAGGAANAGTTYDAINVFGTVSVNGSANLLADTITPSVNGNYFVIINDGADAITGNFANAPDGGTVTLAGNVFTVTYSGDFATDSAVPLSGNDLVLSIAAPEPTSLGLLGLAAGGLLARRRRNKFVC